MIKPKVLSAFSKDEKTTAHSILASKVAGMYGRKFEEGDWSDVYCIAKGIPLSAWSNLHIDVMNDGLGVEHKMLCAKSKKSILDLCGTTIMHPAATRSIRIIDINGDPTDVARDVLQTICYFN